MLRDCSGSTVPRCLCTRFQGYLGEGSRGGLKEKSSLERVCKQALTNQYAQYDITQSMTAWKVYQSMDRRKEKTRTTRYLFSLQNSKKASMPSFQALPHRGAIHAFTHDILAFHAFTHWKIGISRALEIELVLVYYVPN